MSAAIAERVDTTPAMTDNTRPPVAHCYCAFCCKGQEVATSICGMGRKATVELGMDWPAGSQRCAVCADLMMQACQGCGI